jgi:hypothetical protein
MRILHVGNGNEKHRGLRFYDVGRKLNNGLIRNGHNVLFFSDRDVARSSNVWGSSRSKKGMRTANARLIETAEHFKPEFLLFGHADIITRETVKTIRAMFPSAPAAQFNVDPMFIDSTIRNIHRKLDVVDATFVTTGGPILKKASRPGHRAAYMPNPIDRSIETHRCHERTDLSYDLFYAVRATTTKGDYRGNYRLELPRQLRHAMPEMKCHFHGFDGAPEIFGTNFYSALGQCKMGLNLSHIQTTQKGAIRLATTEEKHLYSSDRISQYLGDGLLTFTMAGNALDVLFSEDEIVTFANAEDLQKKLRHFLHNDSERQRIAANGWRKVHHLHNECMVAQYIVEATTGAGFSTDYAWPTQSF